MVSDPRGRDGSRFCTFHNEVGHRTEDCRFLKWEVESLIKRGYLKEFMPRTNSRTEGTERKRRRSGHQYSDRRREDHEEEENAEAVVNYIHGGFASGGDSMTARKKHVKLAVAAIGTSSSRYTDVPDITFTKQDAEGLHFPHDDAIVVKLTIARFLVKRVLVDTGSSVDVIFLAALRQMKYDEDKVEKVVINLVGFNGEPSTVVGKVQMSITAKGVTVNSTLMVVDGDSAYNVILGRPWLSEMRAVASTYHQVVKFPNGRKVETLRSEQAAARSCYVEATRGKTHPTK